MNNFRIFVCYHKRDFIVDGDGLYPIHVGKTLSLLDLNIPGDDCADNISSKNPWYCELTAQYWIWKNIKNASYVGLYHYRRVLDFNPSFMNRNRSYIFCKKQYFAEHCVLDKKEICKYDVVLPRIERRPLSLGDELRLHHVYHDIDILEDIIKQLYPNYYHAYDTVMNKGNKFTPCNILIAKKEIFDDYCKWLFDILFEFEKRISVPCNPYQPRLMGFISERLLLVDFHYHKELKIGYMPMLILHDRKNRPLILLYLKQLICNMCFRLYNLIK